MSHSIKDVLDALDQSITAGSDLLELIEAMCGEEVDNPAWKYYAEFQSAKEDIERIDDAYFSEDKPGVSILEAPVLNAPDPESAEAAPPTTDCVPLGALVSIPLLTETGPDVAAILHCQACSRQFQFFHAEREFFESRGFGPPKRCKRCRAIKAQSKDDVSGAVGRDSFPIKCAQCGGGAVVPFKPIVGRPVYCQDCNAARGRRFDLGRKSPTPG